MSDASGTFDDVTEDFTINLTVCASIIRNDFGTLNCNLFQDENDNEPVFDLDEYKVPFKEDLSDLVDNNGAYELITVSAKDADKSDAFGQASLR